MLQTTVAKEKDDAGDGNDGDDELMPFGDTQSCHDDGEPENSGVEEGSESESRSSSTSD